MIMSGYQYLASKKYFISKMKNMEMRAFHIYMWIISSKEKPFLILDYSHYMG